ncbi:hypothetical protein [Pedobacter sp. SL55]|uniref:hypothetical protein n=1 Tax=Pedobacter sp. SL55 TaxID=2995161 RepID=UPI002271A995|nr:hypothetical protein [Pedobacter sp. SL55]WAC40985.1 hypothetical protein OVA16_00955 [Pedobacter sp. SL55]
MKNLTLIALVVITTLFACKKDRANDENKLSLAEFNAKFSVPTQKFNGTGGAAFSITGAKGMKFDFPANSFIDANGNPVTGAVVVSLKEVLSKRDIILSGKVTQSNGQLLISGGEFQILASQNGQALRLNPAVAVAVKVPTTFNTAPMDLFVWAPTAASDSAWVLDQKARVATNADFYQFNLPNFGWINCDYFYNNPNPKTTITASPVYAGAAPSIKDQRAYMVFDDIKSVAGLPFVMAINKHQSYLNSMPIGLTGKLVILSTDVNDVIYFGQTNFTVSANLHLNLNVAPTTAGQIDAFLNTIN